MSQDIQNSISLFVDGNYLFFSARSAGLNQDFGRLEDNILAKFGGPDKAVIVEKHFYTRPPQDTDPKPVLSWLRNHGWKCATFNYATTHQDSLYVMMVHDMWAAYDKLNGSAAWETAKFVVISGSGTMTHPLNGFPKAVVLDCVAESTNKRLMEVPNVITLDLAELLK